VSWIIPPDGYDEHPPASPGYGAWFIDRILQTLISNEKVWSKTVFFIMYDENGRILRSCGTTSGTAWHAGRISHYSAVAR